MYLIGAARVGRIDRVVFRAECCHRWQVVVLPVECIHTLIYAHAHCRIQTYRRTQVDV